MCCCDVSTCCCGCHPLKRGTIIWAIVDLVLNLIVFIITVAPLGGRSPSWGLWFMILLDVALIIGAHYRISCLLITWQIFMMIYIVVLFFAWIALPAGLVLAIAAELNVSDQIKSYGSNDAFLDQLKSDKKFWDATIAVTGFALLMAIIFPIVYIYFWIVVNNLRKEFSRPPMDQVQPMQYY